MTRLPRLAAAVTATLPMVTLLMVTLLMAGPAAAEPMKGRYELRCQDPQTRQWTVSGPIVDPDILDKPGGGREVRGKGADGRPLVLAMPGDRTCMLRQG